MTRLSRRVKKYGQVAQIMWKSMLAYQADTWIGALMVGFRVLLAFLLWTAVFAGKQEVGGYTLPLMITYALISSLFARLQHQDGLAWQLSGEIREGQFSKYLAHPVSVTWYFFSAGLGRWAYLLLVNGLALLLWALVFSPFIGLPAGSLRVDLIPWLVILLPLGGMCMLLINHFIALLSLKFNEITGFMILKNSVIEFLAGGILPLALLPAPVVLVLSATPFYYVVYYPTSLVLGRQDGSPLLAVAILAGWCLAFFGLSELWFRSARRFYEGVGI